MDIGQQSETRRISSFVRPPVWLSSCYFKETTPFLHNVSSVTSLLNRIVDLICF